MKKGTKHLEETIEIIRQKSLKQFENGMTEETKVKLRNNAKNNPNFGMKNKKHSIETIEKLRLSHLGNVPWNKGKKCPKISLGLMGRKLSDESRLKMSKSRKKGIANGSIKLNKFVFKKGHKSPNKGKTYKEIYGDEKGKDIIERGRLKKIGKIPMSVLDFCRSKSERKRRSILMKKMQELGIIINPKKDTTIEVKIQNFLKQLGIEFLTHQYMKIEQGYQCDIFIPIQEGINQKTIIECDGDYWHGNLDIFPIKNLDRKFKVQRCLDYERTTQLEEKGFRVIRLWEHDIRVMEINVFQNKLHELNTLEVRK